LIIFLLIIFVEIWRVWNCSLVLINKWLKYLFGPHFRSVCCE